MRVFQKGATSKTIYVFIRSSATTPPGQAKTGLTNATSGLKFYHTRARAAASAITLASQTVTGAFSSGGFVEVDATNAPGVYRLDVPDAALATGVDEVVVSWTGGGTIDDGVAIALSADDPITASATTTQIADALLTRDMSAVTEGSGRTPLQALRSLRNKVAVASGTVTVYKEDDSNASWSGAVTGTPAVTQVDPA